MKEKSVRINVEAMKKAIEGTGVSATKMSETILRKSPTYIGSCFYSKSMGKESLETLCSLFSWKMEDMVIVEEEKAPAKEPAKAPVAQLSTDWIVRGLEFNGEKLDKLVELMSAILQENKILNQKVKRIEDQLHSVENATGRCVSSVIDMRGTVNEQTKVLTDIKNTQNLLQGRVNDIRKSGEKTTPLKVVS